MFFLYSKSCEYAIRALMIAAKSDKPCFQVQDICAQAKVPSHYARKALERLVSKKYLEALRGRFGGYRFLVKPSQISVLDLVKAIDGEESLNECVMGLPHCNEQYPCALHTTWGQVKKNYLRALDQKTLTDLNLIGDAALKNMNSPSPKRRSGEKFRSSK